MNPNNSVTQRHILANWPAPSHIGALTTTRQFGCSMPPFDENNLGLHVGNDSAAVMKNRQQLQTLLQLPNEPFWLEQTHSSRCVVVEEEPDRAADAAVTRDSRYPLVIMTADCLPILLCDEAGEEIAGIHSGWRGLANGIVENSLAKMKSKRSKLMAWIGPANCGRCYEVGTEVYETYISRYPFVNAGFNERGDRFLANLPLIAELILQQQGIDAVYQSQVCTFEQVDSFYSYRRVAQTGRMATLIWFK